MGITGGNSDGKRVRKRSGIPHGFAYNDSHMKVPLRVKNIVAKNEKVANFLKNRYDELAILVTKPGHITSRMMKRLSVVRDLADMVGLQNLERIEISAGSIIAIMKDGTRFFVQPDQSTTSALLYDGSYEEAEMALMKSVIKEGWTVLDVGANFGWYASHFSKYVGEKGRVFAFEPIPATFEGLQKNIAFNHAENVTVINRALGEKEEKAYFFLPRQFRGSGGASRYNYFGDKVEVTVTTLDEIVKVHQIQHLDF